MVMMSRRQMGQTVVGAVAFGWCAFGEGLFGPPRLYAKDLRKQDGFAGLLPRSEGPDPYDAENRVRARIIHAELCGITTRIERIEGRFVVLVEEISLAQENQREINRRIDYLCKNEEALETALEETLTAVRAVGEKATALNIRLDRHNQDLQQLSGELACLNSKLAALACMLCGLTERIRRAEFRAFIVGVLVGIGIGAAIGGGGGGGGAIASVGVW